MRLLDVADDADLVELCHERGWTDGLPVVPPTPDRVEAAIAASGWAADDVVCEYAERRRVVTTEQVAVNAVLAGCRPEHVAVVAAIVEAMGDPGFDLHIANASTGGAAVGFVVNGPIRTELGMNCRGNVLGSGNRANASIGRAVRLTQMNAMGSVPGAGNEDLVPPGGRPILDRATIGQPGKYAGYHLPEDEEVHPTLRPLHVERGFAPDDDVVTVFSTAGHVQWSLHQEASGEELVEAYARNLVAGDRLTRSGFLVLVVPPEHADVFVRDGWSKADIREGVFAGTTRTIAWAKEHGRSLTGGLMDRRGAAVQPGDEEATVAVASSPDEILVVVAGGPAGAFAHALFPFGGKPISRRIRRPHQEDT